MSGFLLRWLFAFILLAATYNPTQWSYVRWTMTSGAENLSVAVLSGLVLTIGYIIYEPLPFLRNAAKDCFGDFNWSAIKHLKSFTRSTRPELWSA